MPQEHSSPSSPAPSGNRFVGFDSDACKLVPSRPPLWRGFCTQVSDRLHNSSSIRTFHTSQMVSVVSKPIQAYLSLHVSHQEKCVMAVTGSRKCIPGLTLLHLPPRCIISGMASGSIVLFYNDFNRWHHEYQTRY